MTTLVGAPARVDGVQLIGEMAGSGYRTPPALVRRADGQTLQLTPLLYLVLHSVDGRRGYAEIAELVGAATGRHVTADDVRTLVDSHLRPLGLLRLADGSEPQLKRSDPLLGLKPRFAITSPRATDLLTAPFQFLFWPAVAVVVVAAFLAVTWWVFVEQGLASSAYDAFQRPHLLLLVFVVSILSGGFHEFGHAAAARYGGSRPGVMGAGLYLVWPAFYTDVTDSYRLGRGGRIRTDLGGLYFNAIVVVGTFVWWYATGWEALLLLVATQTLQMVQQLLPLLRFDGYHLLADIAGVPDLYQRIRPTLRGLLPQHWSDPENRMLKPWARAVITFWVLVTIPMMALMLLAIVMALPRLIGTAASVVREDLTQSSAAWGQGGVIDAAAHLLQVLAVLLPTLGCVLILGRIGLRWSRRLAEWASGSFLRRVGAAALSAVVVTGLSWAWWPGPENYRPISPDEDRLFTTMFQSTAPQAGVAYGDDAGALARPGFAGVAADRRLSSGAPLSATFADAESVPTRDEPQLAMVLVPSSGSTTDGQGSGSSAGDAPDGADGLPTDDSDEPWVFPFDRPLAPEEGDNQAVAVNTADGSMSYDVAFALVWADGDEVLNVNEAHAYASCSQCVTVAVAFQVVLIMDDAQVVVPQNLAVAANYDCYECVTAALANQLVLSLQGEPGEEQLLQLAAVWNQLIDFGHEITSYSLGEVAATLEAVKAEIVAILGTAPAVESTGASATASPTVSTSAQPSGSSSPTGTSSAEPSASPSPTAPTTSAPASSSGTTTAPAPSPTPTTSPSPTVTSPSPTQAPEPTTSPTTQSAPSSTSSTATP